MSDKAIKSVRRVFEIFELFDKERRPMTAKEVGDMLGYPLASAHALMKSINEMDYADFDAPNWSYVPSRKFRLLSDWIADFVDRETQLLECMDALNSETQETINLSRLDGAGVKIIHGLECVHAVGVSVRAGTSMPATESLTGITALASLSEERYSTYLSRLERRGSDKSEAPKQRLIKGVRRELQDRGTVSRCDIFVRGIGAVCIPVTTHFSEESMVIGVVGPSDRIKRFEEEHRRTIKRVMAKFGVKCQFKLRNPRKST